MLSNVLVSTVALWAATFGASNPFPPGLVQQVDDRIAPALCVVRYSYESVSPNTGRSRKRNSTALGTIVSRGGLVMVRGHMVIENVRPYNIRVTIGEGDGEQEYKAELLAKPEDVNLVFLQVESPSPLDLPYVRFNSTSTIRLGDNVMVFGILGSALDYARAFHMRFVSSIIDTPRRTLLLDSSLPLGFVAGPIVDRQGRAIGVLGYDLTPAQGGDLYVRSGHPLLYTTDLFQKYIDAPPGPITEEDATDEDGAWLGVFTQALSDDLATYWNLPPDGGVVISTIVPGSPAAESGLQRGDVVVALNDAPVRAKRDREVLAFTRMIREAGAGATVTMRVLRDGDPIEINATLVPRPKSAQDAEEYKDDIFGLTVRELTTDVRIRLNIPQEVEGVLVWRVRSGSWAEIGDIRPGFLILNFGDRPVTDIESFKQAVAEVAAQQPAEVAVFCWVNQATAFFRLEPRWE